MTRAIAVASPGEDISNTTGDSAGEPVLSPANSNADADFLHQDPWDASQHLLENMPELPTMDFFLDYPDDDNALRPSWKNTEDKSAPEPRRLDSAIDMSDVPTISPTQAPRRVETKKVAIHGLNTSSTQALPTFPYSQISPKAQFPFRAGCHAQDAKGVVVAAAEILEKLECKICAGLSAIDEVLRINKEATQGITELTSRADYINSLGGSIVVVAAAHHVVCLFESACGEVYSPPSRSRWSMSSRTDNAQQNSASFGNAQRRFHGSSAGCSNGLAAAPGIGFGSFLLDPQEQAALGAQIISTELHRSLRMVQSLSMPLQTRSVGPDPASAAVDRWLQDLKQRLRSLISAVESSERMWPR
ncbi:hypothetical protein PENARI_c028G02266 [Penicillium arizonense]|uniref:Aflatoxin regulatory protein domain-containing protein n=1 Tax=Penicillium arizonense TaxID=1835702 RepID=A0A1F5L5J4_PENAI|nr:hypothetical protein PENARI_c028G02266 [Penicillium arizonense]OGE48493.1 hypothetical protein PENARI_c028G02266 [Penicillium arizonense]